MSEKLGVMKMFYKELNQAPTLGAGEILRSHSRICRKCHQLIFNAAMKSK